ncbi:hypothetical protein E4J89_09095 [Arthrobacter sp. CAU 1506]|uniref:hypothetical protein n=1 Tax=Arthrobacter sp. CAU 1506 TaxID=2560052 RepID=UPI0010AD9250|nr:hypothetical protein [Arthrobacter sp. CAU 1506]TJY69847.1 hypothetical protein E4J89_09095 [Arthrobacter sp. CAU 1506]
MSQSSQTHATAGTAVAGPFTARDLVVGAGIVLLFLSSVLPLEVIRGIGVNLWNSAGLFQLALGILLPAVVLVLFVVRRLAPQTPLRIGSLSVDQFASVVASLALAFYFLTIVTVYSVSGVIGFIGALVLFAGTVCGRWIPQLAADFAGRPEMPAHPVARDAVPAAPKPKAAKPAAQRPGAPYGTEGGEPATHDQAVQGGTTGGYRATAPAAAGWDRGSAQQPGTGQFAAPSGNGAAGFAGAAAAVQATQERETADGASTDAAGRETAATPVGVQQATDLEADDSVAPGAADGEAVGIPVTEDSSASATTRAATLAADGVARDVGYSAKTVVGSPDPSGAGQSVPETAGAGVAETQNPGDTVAQARTGEPPAETAVPAGGALGGAAAAAEPAGAGETAAAAEPTAARTGTAATGEASARTGATRADAVPEAATAAMPSVAANGADRDPAKAASASSPISATRDAYDEAEEEYEAFWFAVGRTRPVLDENTGQVMFTVEPGSWILALQDRGDEFLVQHTDGRVGVLRDLTNIERA